MSPLGDPQRIEDPAAAEVRAVLDSASCSIIAADLDGTLRTFNATAERWLGYTAAELVGRSTPEILHDPDEVRRRAEELSQELGESIAPGMDVFTARVRRGLPDEREWTYVCRDGRRFPVLLSLTGLRDELGRLTGFMGVGVDLTVHKRADQRVSVQHAAARVLAEASSLAEAVPVLLRTICHDLQWDFGAYWVVYDGLDLIAGSAVWHQPDHFAEFDSVTRQLAFPPGIDLPGCVWQSGKALWVPDVTREGFFLRADLARREGLHAGFAFPIRFRGRTLGVLEFFSREVLPPDPDLLKVLDTVGTQIGQFLDRQQAVERLAQSEERFRALVENSSDAFALLDGDGGFVYASPGNARVLGREPPALQGRSFFEMVHPDDRATVRKCLDNCLARTGTRVEFECRLPVRADEWRHIEGVFTNRADVPTVEAVVANYRDVTERRLAEEALRDSEARYRDLFENATDLILSVDAEGRFVYVNPAWREALGYRPEEIADLRLPDVLHPSSRDATMALVTRALSEGRVARAEVEFLTREGRTLSAEGSLNGRPTAGPAPPGVRGIFRDVTQRRAVERMKAEFVSTVSHELRTPLTSIRGSLGLIAGGAMGGIPPQAARLVDIAHKSSERLVRLINDILDVEKIESGHLQFQLRILDLRSLAEQALEANRAYGEQFGVRFVLAVEADRSSLRVLADSDRLMQVLNNLLSNAAKFSPAGGEVTLRIAPVEEEWVRLSVQDRGPGIPEAFRPRVFQRFAQADSSDRRQRGGTGLGLSISKAIVDRLGGRIGFETGPSGTTFHVELPVCLDPQASDTPRVLICEDDPGFITLLRVLLGHAGYAADEARTVAEARDLLARNTYACATLDLRLPDGDGLELLRELRANAATRKLPVIIVSAIAPEGQAAADREALAVLDWLDKPLDHARLLQAVGHGVRDERPGGAAVREQGHSRPRILVAENDPDTVHVVAAVLEPLGIIATALTLAEARQRLTSEPFDLLVLDLEFPEGSGLELLPHLPRRDGAPIPVLVFSAREMPADRGALVAGALVKSRTSNAELLAAVQALLARG